MTKYQRAVVHINLGAADLEVIGTSLCSVVERYKLTVELTALGTRILIRKNKKGLRRKLEKTAEALAVRENGLLVWTLEVFIQFSIYLTVK